MPQLKDRVIWREVRTESMRCNVPVQMSDDMQANSITWKQLIV